MTEWSGHDDCWIYTEEQLAPKVWLFMCKRPDGYDWSPHVRERLINWAHIYVFDKPVNWPGQKTLEHYALHDEDPLMLSCLEIEMRKKYEVHNDGVV